MKYFRYAGKPVAMAAVADGGGPTWRKVEAMVADMKPLSMRTNQWQFREGELLQFAIDVPHQGT